MSKVKNTKLNKDLRREVELLRAQLKVNKTDESVLVKAVNLESKEIKKMKEIAFDSAYIKKDLIKTLIFSIMAFGAIFFMWIKYA